MTADPSATSWRESREAFWTLVVGAPAGLSVLRLWVESGGELQTTLLLVSNVGPLNLGAALFATVTQLVTVVLVACFAAGGIVRATAAAAGPDSRLRTRPPMVARMTAAAPSWFVAAAFLVAALTWKIIFLPLLVPAAVAAFQRPPWRLLDQPVAGVGFCLAAAAGYFWLVGPAIGAAWTAQERVIAVLLAVPPLVAFGVAGPLPGWFGLTFATVAQPAILGLVVLAVWSALQTPILPLVVTEVGTDEGTELLRGHVVSVDDVHMVLLQQQGGVRYVPTGDVRSTVMCATPQELPAFTTRVRDYHVEDSLLIAIGRRVRPAVQIDPLCRITELSPDGRPAPLPPARSLAARHGRAATAAGQSQNSAHAAMLGASRSR
jgi:hypothetical protein